MREIKYRAYENGTMYTWEEIRHNFYEHLANEKIVVVEYTGLKDKHGKEVFEGDIWKGNEGVGVIRWSGNGYSSQDEDGAWWMPYDFEIIGNIHEHPHLLHSEEREGKR